MRKCLLDPSHCTESTKPCLSWLLLTKKSPLFFSSCCTSSLGMAPWYQSCCSRGQSTVRVRTEGPWRRGRRLVKRHLNWYGEMMWRWRLSQKVLRQMCWFLQVSDVNDQNVCVCVIGEWTNPVTHLTFRFEQNTQVGFYPIPDFGGSMAHILTDETQWSSV